MIKMKIITISFIIALIFGLQFKWIQYKGNQMVSIFEAYNLEMTNVFFDFSLLFIIHLLFFYFGSGFQKLILNLPIQKIFLNNVHQVVAVLYE